jgi:hypothetical protein
VTFVTPSIKRFLGRFFIGKSVDETEWKYAAEIPPAMSEALRLEGVRNFILLPFALFCAAVTGELLLGWIWGDEPLSLRTIVPFISYRFLPGLVAELLFYKRVLEAPTVRELSYHRDHGRWRWER